MNTPRVLLLASLHSLLLTGCATTPTPGAPLIAPGENAPWRASRAEDEQASPPNDATLGAYLDAALSAHPTLQLQHARWARLEASTRAVWVIKDPVLMYTFAPLPIQTRLGAQRHIVSLEQTLPWPGIQERAVNVQAELADAQADTFDAAYLKLRHDITQHYWEVWHQEQRLDITHNQNVLLEGIEQGLRAQVETGRQPASSLSRIAIRRVQLDERIRSTQTSLEVAHARLLATMGLRPDLTTTSLPTLTSSPDTTVNIPEVTSLTKRGVLPPHITALAHQTRGMRAQLELTHHQNRPTFMLGAQWSVIGADETIAAPDAGRDAVMLKVGLSVPIWQGAQHARLEAAEVAVVVSQTDEALAIITWTSDLEVTRARILDLQRRLATHDTTLLPMARAGFDMARGDYEVERADFTALLDAVDTLLVLELSQLDLRAELARQITTWQWLEGRPSQPLDTEVSP